MTTGSIHYILPQVGPLPTRLDHPVQLAQFALWTSLDRSPQGIREMHSFAMYSQMDAAGRHSEGTLASVLGGHRMVLALVAGLRSPT